MKKYTPAQAIIYQYHINNIKMELRRIGRRMKYVKKQLSK
jgi:hypothetical protein